MTEQEAIEQARAYFLTEDNTYGCAETTLVVLQQAYGLSAATDSSPAMTLNGGIAWGGGPCGAITGAALAVGRLAGRRIDDHREAKRVARGIVSRLVAAFQARYGAINCRDLTGEDISTAAGHAAFIAGKVWHGVCMDQIEFAIHQLLPLQDEAAWQQAAQESD
jgi:C_GCAxxG_C_C family probable redox protein